MKRIRSYTRAESVDHALQVAHRAGDDAMYLAGGQSLVNVMKQRLVADGLSVVDIGHISELSYVEKDGDRIRIGAATTHSDLVGSELLETHLPAMPEMVEQIGDVQIRNKGTIGGDVAQADPSADYPVLLAAVDATFDVVGRSDARSIPAAEFFVGYFETALRPGELLIEVSIPVPPVHATVGFAKFAKRHGDFPIVNAASRLSVDDGTCSEASVHVGCVQGTPAASAVGEEELVGTALGEIDPGAVGARVAEDIEIDPDERASTGYKRRLVRATVQRVIDDCIGRLA